jgi:hypothetical protein
VGEAEGVEIVRTGRWLYDGSVERPVDVVGLTYDFWYEIAKADDRLDPGEVPMEPDENGLLYYVRFRRAGETSTPTWPDSGGSADLEAAVRAAEVRVPSPIRWDPPRRP